MPLVFRFGEYRYTIIFSHDNMTLKLRFGKLDGTEEILFVNWNGTKVTDFPLVSIYNNRYWSFVFYDKGTDTDYVLLFSETKASGLPCDMFGIPLPSTNLHEYLKINESPVRPCECGAKFTSFPSMHSYYCPLWSKP
jgi:hypothetical protein